LKWDREHGEEGTFLFLTSPHIYPDNWACPELTHPCVEETFVLSGKLTRPFGKVNKGAYFWRPEAKPHGPFGTREGGFCLARFKYGKHINIWAIKTCPTPLTFPTSQDYQSRH
jgi:hypothetical protein